MLEHAHTCAGTQTLLPWNYGTHITFYGVFFTPKMNLFQKFVVKNALSFLHFSSVYLLIFFLFVLHFFSHIHLFIAPLSFSFRFGAQSTESRRGERHLTFQYVIFSHGTNVCVSQLFVCI